MTINSSKEQIQESSSVEASFPELSGAAKGMGISRNAEAESGRRARKFLHLEVLPYLEAKS